MRHSTDSAHSTSRWVMLSDGARPTEDIYFLESVAPLLKAQGHRVERVDTRQHALLFPWKVEAQLCRLKGARLVVCRSLGSAWLWLLESNRSAFASIHYLIDDDIAAAVKDHTLPAAYRQRMERLKTRQPRLLALADEVVVCSPVLAEHVAAQHPDMSVKLRVATPSLISPLPSLDHFATGPDTGSVAAPDEANPWCIGYHGTRAHLADMQHIAPALVKVHDRWPSTRLEIMLGRYSPEVLRSLARCDTPAAMSWPLFRDYQRRRRIHIGLAPMLETPFNVGKSYIKFLDIAVMGGVGVYSRRQPLVDIVEHGINGLLADDTPESWYQCLNWLLTHPDDARRMAEQAAVTAREMGNPRHAAEQWLSATEGLDSRRSSK